MRRVEFVGSCSEVYVEENTEDTFVETCSVGNGAVVFIIIKNDPYWIREAQDL